MIKVTEAEMIVEAIVDLKNTVITIFSISLIIFLIFKVVRR